MLFELKEMATGRYMQCLCLIPHVPMLNWWGVRSAAYQIAHSFRDVCSHVNHRTVNSCG
jgi:hypothetical protein